MQLYRFVLALIGVTILGCFSYFAFVSISKVTLFSVGELARFLWVHNMIVAINSSIIAAIIICLIDGLLSLMNDRYKNPENGG